MKLIKKNYPPFQAQKDSDAMSQVDVVVRSITSKT